MGYGLFLPSAQGRGCPRLLASILSASSFTFRASIPHMVRIRRHSLRGSVRQNVSVRISARGRTRLGVLAGYGAVGFSLLAVLGMSLWLWRIGWPQRQIAHVQESLLSMTADARFAVKDIVVEGRRNLDRGALMNTLKLPRGAPILGFDPAEARRRVLALPWVADATVQRRFPDTVRVVIRERSPMARWQFQGHLTVIDEDGRELFEAKPESFAMLPLVVGAGAPEATAELLKALRGHPRAREQVAAATRIGERRWDLYLRSGHVVKLPEDGVEYALKRLAGIIEQKTFLPSEVKAIDLRLSDRLIIQSDVPVDTDSPPRPQIGEKRP